MAELEAQPSMLPSGGGPLSRLAWQQYLALARMRANALGNGFRTKTGAFEFGARAVSFGVYSCFGLGFGFGAGATAYALAAHHPLHSLAVELWVLCALWQAISIVLASFLERFDLGGLLRFPLGFGSFCLLHVVFGLLDVSTIVGGLGCVGIVAGVAMARPELWSATALAMAGFALFNVLLVRAIFAWLDRWLAKRRSREMISAAVVLLLLGVQMLNPVLHDREWPLSDQGAAPSAQSRLEGEIKPWLKAASRALAWGPPGLAAAAVQDAARRQTRAEAESLGLLGVYAMAAAALLGVRLRAEYRGENLGEAARAGKPEKREEEWLVAGGGPIAAEIEKELRTFSRSLTQAYAISVPPIMVIIVASLFRSGGSITQHASRLALPVCVAYGLLGFTQLIYNSLGPEGKGIQMLFLFPVPLRTILLAKNLFHAGLYGLVALLAGILASVRLGRPDAAVVAVTVAWVAFALPANLAAGNVLSLTMAYRVSLGRIGRQSGSQANALLSMLIQTTILGAGAGVISLASLFGELWAAVPALLALSVVALAAWVMVLRNADKLAQDRRDTLIARMVKAE